MKLEQINQAVEGGQTVHWVNSLYVVVKDRLGQFFVVCKSNKHAIGLTHRDGITLNGTPEQFFITS